MKPFDSIFPVPAQRAGFTRIEVLVVIVVVALLVILRLTALANVKSQTKIAQCASNLRQFAAAVQIYAGEFDDQLPSSYLGYWMWDMDRNVADSLVGVNSNFQKVCYCPGTSPRFTEADNLRLWSWSPSYRALGYALTFPGTATLIKTNWNLSLTPQSLRYGPLVVPPASTPSQRVLLADATISGTGQHHPAQKFTGDYNYTDFPGSYPVHYTTAHMDREFPAGGNVAMLDGHVEWREFRDMTVRGYGGVGGGNDNGTSPTFWW